MLLFLMELFFMKRLAILLCLVVFCLSAAYSYQLSPLNATYDSSGPDSQKIYTIVNDSDSPIAIEISAVKRNIDINGEEYNEDASAYFSIQPSKMIIRPQSTQLVRVQYRGPSTLTEEQSFRIISEQIPYSVGAQVPDSGQMISFLFVYSTSAYVRPSRVIESVTSTAEVDEDGKLSVTIENTGSVHQLLNSLEVAVTSENGASYTFTEEELEAISGISLLTNSKVIVRTENAPSELLSADNLEASVSYDYSYSR